MPDQNIETSLAVVQPAGKLAKKYPRVKKKQTEKQFVPSIKIQRIGDKQLIVPRDPEANRNASIMLAEIARGFIKDQVNKISDSQRILTPTEIKELITAMKLANEVCIVAHENILTPTETPKGKASNSDTGNILKGMEAVAKGLAKGNAEAHQKAIDDFMAKGKKIKQADVIDIQP